MCNRICKDLPLRIGTRSSALALAQAHEVRTLLMQVHNLPIDAFEIVPISTEGDRIASSSLAFMGGKGLFTKEIEMALQEGHIDIAVHSTKDMPVILPDNLHLSVYLKREDPRDAFIGKTIEHIRDLPYGASIGSSSTRRQAQIHRIRPDLNIVPYRGNIQTRLAGLTQKDIAGTLLALAGLKRLHLQAVVTEIMDPEYFLPTPGQGVIVVESRTDDSKTNAFIKPLADVNTHYEMTCERVFMATLDGSCRMPLGGLAKIRGDKIYFSGMIMTLDGRISYEINLHGFFCDAAEIGKNAAEKLKKDAGSSFFENWV
ncbi:MAG: hydroxymethylbilane synthase [Candidatus Tokpelaia sp. JSC085]|nr:MAG: hydroxymethylbilane synthase [Candidatus Tokpelaia sp. JSC085]